ncbi:hypothetical protein G7046_g6849 [Stylonectria norvegica]|nr:hypothetical protein G7046_g6849 [Stylonectria norvegica]
MHIAKYTTAYRLLFPTARILIIRCSLAQFIRPSLRRRLLAPALPILQSLGASDTPRLLVHVFSNGGISTAVSLCEAWSSTPGSQPMPPHIVVMDSCPGFFSWQRNHHAIALGVPWWASPLVHLLILVGWLTYVPWGYGMPQDTNAAVLNTTTWRAGEVRRTYVYGTGDEAVDWRDVEEHGRRAKEAGTEVRMERFEGGRHVAHIRVDGERYWRAVKETWEG